MTRVSLPSDLEELFTGETNLVWKYSPSERRYYSFRGETLHSRLRGQNLPDPMQLFTARCELNEVSKDSSAAAIFRPVRDTFLLWDDWGTR